MIEQPPSLPDKVLQAYLGRLATKVASSLITSSTAFPVSNTVINPIKGRLYYVDANNTSTAMPSAGLYIFNGSTYDEIGLGVSTPLELGTRADQAYYGNLGDAAYKHSKINGNPHGTKSVDIGLDNVDNTRDLDKPLSRAAINEFAKYVLKTTTVNGQLLSGNVVLRTSEVNPTANRQYVTSFEIARLRASAMVQFGWGDATPARLINCPAGKAVLSITITILIAFDVASSIVVGDSLNNARLFNLVNFDLTKPGSYTVTPNYVYAASTPIIYTIAAGGGNSQGRGLISITLQD